MGQELCRTKTYLFVTNHAYNIDMRIYTYVGRVFTPLEICFWTVFLGIPTGLGIGALFTKQNPPIPVIGWTILAIAILGMYSIATDYLLHKWRWQKNLRILLVPPQLVVGWKDERYCVSGEAVNAVITDCVSKMQGEFPDAVKALEGCVVWFREPTWIQQGAPGFIARQVAGVQDGQLLIIGWNVDLQKTALKHELAHRILQVYDGDPPENVAHQIMIRLGVI